MVAALLEHRVRALSSTSRSRAKLRANTLKDRHALPYRVACKPARRAETALVPSSRRIRVFGAMEVTPLSVDADECPTCGQTVPAEGAVEDTLRSTTP